MTSRRNAIYAAYQLVCHQWAFRSYFLFGPELDIRPRRAQRPGRSATRSTAFVGSPELGYKVAFCERDVAIYLAVLAAGLAYGRLRERLPSLGLVGVRAADPADGGRRLHPAVRLAREHRRAADADRARCSASPASG